MRGIALQLAGQKFGKLTAIRREGRDGHNTALWLCECECGNMRIVKGTHLVAGVVQSCGCAHKIHKHGMSKSNIYSEWTGAKTRCGNPRANAYDRYGERGIHMCDEWKNDFRVFYDDVSKLPHFGEPGYTLDRIDNDGNYEPGNVRWADNITQSNNRRSNVMITYKGETHTLMEWVKMYNLDYTLIYRRLRRGWDFERAITTPVRQR